MKTHADFDNAISFDELLDTPEEQPKQSIWIATIGEYAPLIIDRPTALQDNTPQVI